jgi:hypothetical protein
MSMIDIAVLPVQEEKEQEVQPVNRVAETQAPQSTYRTEQFTKNGKDYTLLAITPPDQPNTRWPFKFGVGKARMVLANIDQIKQFVADNQ